MDCTLEDAKESWRKFTALLTRIRLRTQISLLTESDSDAQGLLLEAAGKDRGAGEAARPSAVLWLRLDGVHMM